MRPKLQRLAPLWASDRVLGALFAALIVYYLAIPGVFEGKHSGDGLHAFNYLNAIFYHHTLDMQNVLPEFKRFLGVNEVTHHMPNRNPIGPVIFWTPFYLVACALAFLWKLVGGTPLAPNSAFHSWWSGLGTLACVLWGARQLFVLLDRRYGRLAARLGAIAAVGATAIAWYTVTQPMYQHGIVFGMSAAFVEYWERRIGDPDPRRLLVLGLWGGFLGAIRGQEILFLILPASDVVLGLIRPGDRVRWLWSGIVALLAALVGVLPQLLVWHYYFGFHKPHLEPLRPYEPFFLSALFSTRAGLVPWTPIVYASTAGLVARGFGAKERRFVLPLVIAFALNVYVVACGWLVHGAFGYGARRLSDGAVLFAVGVALLAVALGERPRARRALLGFVAFCVIFNVAGMEAQRSGRARSSGACTRRISDYLRDLRGPEWFASVGRVFDVIGNPFVQPAGWIFALYHRAPLSTFDIVVGMPFLERDGAWLGLLPDLKQLQLDEKHAPWIIEGLKLAPQGQPSTVTGEVRLLMSFFAKEKIGVVVHGTILDGSTDVLWNGQAIPAKRVPQGLRFEVPAEVARAGTNEIKLRLPLGSKLHRLELESYSVPTR